LAGFCHSQVSEELNSVETQLLSIVINVILRVSEELNSVETDIVDSEINEGIEFQKNLIVWKPKAKVFKTKADMRFRRT